MSRTAKPLHERDFFTWTQEQAAALRRAAAEHVNTSAPIDWDHVAEEIEDMGRAQADALEAAYRVLLLHLLKWDHQPGQRSASWRGSIVEHRRRALRLIEQNPGLKAKRQAMFERAYEDAREQAAAETGLPIETFPERCVWTLDEVMTSSWPRE